MMRLLEGEHRATQRRRHFALCKVFAESLTWDDKERGNIKCEGVQTGQADRLSSDPVLVDICGIRGCEHGYRLCLHSVPLFSALNLKVAHPTTVRAAAIPSRTPAGATTEP